MAKWLMKSEPNTYSIDDLKKEKVTHWDGVRNYQARNFMKEMKKGDEILFYHSNAEPPGIAGVAKIHEEAKPDPTQFNKKSKYYDEKSSKDNPRWWCPDVKYVAKFKKLIPLSELREQKPLSEMILLKKGSRLSVTPVSDKEFNAILKLAKQ